MDRTVSVETIEALEEFVANHLSDKAEYLESEIGSEAYENVSDSVTMEEWVVDREYLKDVLSNAIKSLTSREKKIIYMLFWEGKSQEEVAREIGIDVWALYKIYERSLEKMRKVINKEHKLGVDYV